ERFERGVIQRLLRLEAIRIGPVEPVEHIGGLFIRLAPVRPEIGNDAVLPIVRLDLPEAAPDLVNLDADRVLELLTPLALPLCAGDRHETPGEQAFLAHLHGRDRAGVETLHRALVYLAQLVGVGVLLFERSVGFVVAGHTARQITRAAGRRPFRFPNAERTRSRSRGWWQGPLVAPSPHATT